MSQSIQQNGVPSGNDEPTAQNQTVSVSDRNTQDVKRVNQYQLKNFTLFLIFRQMHKRHNNQIAWNRLCPLLNL